MKRISLPLSSLIVSSLIVVLIIIPTSVLVTVAAVDENNANTECQNIDDKESCKNNGNWVDETFQFLQEKVFNQKQVADETNQHSFLSLLDQGGAKINNNNNDDDDDTTKTKDNNAKNKKKEKDDNPYIELFERLTTSIPEPIKKFTNNGTKSSKKKKQTKNNKKSSSSSSTTDNKVLNFILDQTKIMQLDDGQSNNGDGIGIFDTITIFTDTLKEVMEQLKNTFGAIVSEFGLEILPIAMTYYIGKEDEIKNPTWKRKQHRFYKPITKSLVLELHDALYLSQLSYVNTEDQIKDGLKDWKNNTWQYLNGTTESLPNLPAHFLIIHKHIAPLTKEQKPDPIYSLLPWENNKEKKINELEICLVIRGTKDLADALSDGLLEPLKYEYDIDNDNENNNTIDGYAHGGILTSGKAIVKQNLPYLKNVLEVTGFDRIKLYLVGHSLGAGTAAIAAMEFKKYENTIFSQVDSIGFGCPSLLSYDLSLLSKDYITTVVTDADIVPRMSGSSMVNILLDMLEYDFTNELLEDAIHTVERANSVLLGENNKNKNNNNFFQLPSKDFITKWLGDFLKNEVQPTIIKRQQSPFERRANLLQPPGTCIHLYRDGIGFTGTYTPCDFFTSIDIARTLIDDHLIVPGYHKALLSMVRDWDQNHNFDFVHDIASLPA